MAHGDFTNVPRRTASAKVLYDKAFDIAKNPKDDEYQRPLASMIYRFLDKKLEKLIKLVVVLLKVIAQLHKLIIRKFIKCKV